jgi:hypothetical protein
MGGILCKKCILPHNYAGLIVNNEGICNLCKDYDSLQYEGENKLKEDIANILKDKRACEYDCVIGLSGGRDSTYLLWYIVKILKLKPLAVLSDSGLIPEMTISNINNAVKILGVDLVIKQHEFLKKTVLHFLKSWAKYPDPATLITLCTGCRLGIAKLIDEEAINRNIPLIFSGGTPFEKGLFKKNLISTNRNSNLSFLLGYCKKVIRNPSLITNLDSLKIQIDEYFTTPWGFMFKRKKQNFVRIEPFYKYFKWDEKEIEKTIRDELNWKRYPGMESSYRGDCEIGLIRQYLYNKMLGYNDKDDHLSWLVRDGQLSREEALERIEKEKETSMDILKEIFNNLGIDFYNYMCNVEKNIRKYNIACNSK